MTTYEFISSSEHSDEEPDSTPSELDRLYYAIYKLEQLHREYFGCTPGVPSIFRIGRKALNSLTNSVEAIYRTTEDVKQDIISQYQRLRDDFLSIEPTIDRDGIREAGRAKLASIEDELHDPSYKRFGLL